MGRWIKIYEEVRGHWIYQNPIWYKWWTDMLFEASFKDSKVLVKRQIVELKRGQMLGSISYFVKRWNASKDQVIAFLKVLQYEGMVNKNTDKNITIITICNYDSYQGRLDNNPDNLCDNKSDNPCDNKSDNKSDTNKERIEGIEYNNITNNSACAYTREENVGWVESVERGFVERYKAQGCPMAAARATGKKAQEILQLLEVYSATREAKGRGHRDFEEFRNLFLWHVQNDKISIPVVRAEKSSPKVIGNAELRKMMEESGWQS